MSKLASPAHQRFENLCAEDARLSSERGVLLAKLRGLNVRLARIDDELRKLVAIAALGGAPSVDAMRADRKARIYAAAELMLRETPELPATAIAAAVSCEPHGLPRMLDANPLFEKFHRGTSGRMLAWYRLATVCAE